MDAITNQYLNKGKRLMPLKDGVKVPNVTDWANAKGRTLTQLKATGCTGYCWALDDTDLVIDVDIKKDGVGAESFARLVKDCGNIIKSVISPSGGWHCYLKKPANVKISKKQDAYPNIDFLSKGCQVVIPPTKGYKQTGFFLQMPAKNILLDTLSHEADIASVEEGSFTVNDVRGGENYKRLGEILDVLSPECSHDEWVTIGMAIHHEGNGLDSAKEIWREWSKLGSTYNDKDFNSAWVSFGKKTKRTNITPITIGTLEDLYKKAIRLNARKDLNDILLKINNAIDYQDIEGILVKSGLQDIGDIPKNTIAKAAQDRLKIITNSTVPIETLRKLQQSRNDVKTSNHWVDDWGYIINSKMYYRFSDDKLHDKDAFKNECGEFVPVNVNNSKEDVVVYLQKSGLLKSKSFVAAIYSPQEKGKIIMIDNQQYINTFKSASIPKSTKPVSTGAFEAIARVEKHFDALCKEDGCTGLFMDWLSHMAQHQGKLVRFAPLIIGVQGLGKGYIRNLLEVVNGACNVAVIKNDTITTAFNDWATGAALGVFEEIWINGRQRGVVMNGLKDVITNDKISIHPKGAKSFTTINTQNYLALTNHKDAIYLEKNDRRWWVIDTPFNTIKDYLDEVNEPNGDIWFGSLFSDLELYSEELRYYFLNRTISDEFKALSIAPMTPSKIKMIGREKINIDGYDSVVNTINENTEYVNVFYVHKETLFAGAQAGDSGMFITQNDQGRIWKALEINYYSEGIKLGEATRRVHSWRQIPHDTLLRIKKLIKAGELDKALELYGDKYAWDGE